MINKAEYQATLKQNLMKYRKIYSLVMRENIILPVIDKVCVYAPEKLSGKKDIEVQNVIRVNDLLEFMSHHVHLLEQDNRILKNIISRHEYSQADRERIEKEMGTLYL